MKRAIDLACLAVQAGPGRLRRRGPGPRHLPRHCRVRQPLTLSFDLMPQCCSPARPSAGSTTSPASSPSPSGIAGLFDAARLVRWQPRGIRARPYTVRKAAENGLLVAGKPDRTRV
jgi:hypothetical protein